MLYTEEMRIKYLKSLGRDVDENGKSYTIFPNVSNSKEDEKEVTGLSKVLNYVYGNKEDNMKSDERNPHTLNLNIDNKIFKVIRGFNFKDILCHKNINKYMRGSEPMQLFIDTTDDRFWNEEKVLIFLSTNSNWEMYDS